MLLRPLASLSLLLSAPFVNGGAKAPLNGPDYEPPFEIKTGGRVDGELRTESFLDKRNDREPALAASLVFGNKRVAVRERSLNLKASGNENLFTIYVNEEAVMHCVFVASYQMEGQESVPMMANDRGETLTLEADPETGVISVRNRYPLPNGEEAEFIYTLEDLGESRVRASWDIGVNEDQIQTFRASGANIGGALLYFDIDGDYRKNGIQIDGTKIDPIPTDTLKAKQNERFTVWKGTLKTFTYAPGKPFYGFEILSETGLSGSLREIYQYNRIDCGFMLRLSQPQGSFILDLGKVAEASAETPPPVEGHDLWAQDALHIPQSPTRNLFPNPSFEQGMRYWRWWYGGAKFEPSEILRFDIDPEAGLFGDSAMVINPVQRGSQTPRSFSLPSAKGKTTVPSQGSPPSRSN